MAGDGVGLIRSLVAFASLDELDAASLRIVHVKVRLWLERPSILPGLIPFSVR